MKKSAKNGEKPLDKEADRCYNRQASHERERENGAPHKKVWKNFKKLEKSLKKGLTNGKKCGKIERSLNESEAAVGHWKLNNRNFEHEQNVWRNLVKTQEFITQKVRRS